MTVGAAVVGLGVGEAHARAYAALEGCELLWVHDLDGGRAAAIAGATGGPRVASAYDEVLADPRVDLVSIASYDDAHYEQALAALRAGKHVFVEKPLCRTLDEARAISAARGDRLVSSNLVLRSAHLYRWLRDRLSAGELGTPYAFDGDYVFGRLPKITEGWRGKVDDYSVMLGGGIHLVDLMLWLTGQRPRTVSAAGNRISTEGTAFRYDDYVAATYVFPSGLVGRVTANFGSVHRHQHVVRVFGTAASFLYDDAGARLHRSRDPDSAPETVDLPPLPASKAELIPDFVRRVGAGERGDAEAQHELDVVAACVAADRALAEGGVVDIEYP